jgi:hypothetical protein
MTDLRPEALLALADELEEQHTFSAFWSAVDDAVATLRALAAQGDVVVTWDEARTRILAVTRQDDEHRILSVIAEAPAQPMAGEPVARVAELEQLLKVMERQYAEALERIQKMQPVAWLIGVGGFTRSETTADQLLSLGRKVTPLYRFPIGEDK